MAGSIGAGTAAEIHQGHPLLWAALQADEPADIARMLWDVTDDTAERAALAALLADLRAVALSDLPHTSRSRFLTEFYGYRPAGAR
jgi:hypothetical protein